MSKWTTTIISIICIFLATPISRYSNLFSDLLLGIGLLGIITVLYKAFFHKKDKSDKGIF